MSRLIAFLRAINVGGHTVEMAKLKKLFEQISLTGVETFIASGNVVFDAPRGDPAALENKIAAHLEKRLGYEVATFLRTPDELGAVLAYRAFKNAVPDSTLYIGFQATEAEAAAKKAVAALSTATDDLHLRGRELYWRRHGRFSDGQISGAQLERALGQPTTLRKVTTVEKLAKKYG
jgi:uncharacterized protein (DUF1697 family)